jgi:hypothetical protein
MGKQYVRFDEIEDVLSSLDLLALSLPLTHKQPSYWKWVIISAQSAFQGAMVCVLGGTSGIGVLSERSAKATLRWHDDQKGQYPEPWMADFNTLLDRCKKPERDGGIGLTLSASQERDIKRLHDHFRNEFAHFIPQSWSIQKAGLPRIIGATVDGIEALMSDDAITYKLTVERTRRCARRIRQTRKALKAM